MKSDAFLQFSGAAAAGLRAGSFKERSPSGRGIPQDSGVDNQVSHTCPVSGACPDNVAILLYFALAWWRSIVRTLKLGSQGRAVHVGIMTSVPVLADMEQPRAHT